jgi:bifunctional UDP-N-acetylglucosamine pyrophosphorylase/glucosamine-1-phosphate N-acetyltransferase
VIHAALALSESLAQAPFLGAPLASFWRARLDQAGLVLATGGPGPWIIVDGRFPAVSPEALVALAETLPGGGGALRSPDGPVVATARVTIDGGTPAMALLAHPGGRTLTLPADEALPVDDGWGLSLAERAVVDHHLRALARSGVRLHDPSRIWVEPSVTVAPGAELWAGAILRGHTTVGPRAVVHAGAVLVDTVVEAGAVVKPYSVCTGAHIGAESAVGPMAHLRPGARLHTDVKVGNFVEVKKSELHPGVRVSHLTYLGDADIGARSNIGAGTITCNYDGFGKHRTVIGEGCFVGSNTSLIAPLTLGDGVIVGAGSTLSRDVPADALAVERAEEKVLAGYAPRLHARNRKRAEQRRGEPDRG